MTRFAAASSYELAVVIVVIIAAVAGYHADSIFMAIFNITDFG